MPIKRWIQLASLVLLLIIPTYAAQAKQPVAPPTYEEVVGTVWIWKENGIKVQAYNGLPIEKGDEVKTDQTSSVTLSWHTTADKITVTQQAWLKVEALNKQKGATLTLYSGETFTSINPEAKRKFIINTPTNQYVSKGTNFLITVSPLTGANSLSVLSGIVEMNSLMTVGGTRNTISPAQTIYVVPGSKPIQTPVQELYTDLSPTIFRAIEEQTSRIVSENERLIEQDVITASREEHMRWALLQAMTNYEQTYDWKSNLVSAETRKLLGNPKQVQYTEQELQALKNQQAMQALLAQRLKDQQTQAANNRELRELEAERLKQFVQQRALEQKALEEQQTQLKNQYLNQLSESDRARLQAQQQQREKLLQEQWQKLKEYDKPLPDIPVIDPTPPTPSEPSEDEQILNAELYELQIQVNQSLQEALHYTEETKLAVEQILAMPQQNLQQKQSKKEALFHALNMMYLDESKARVPSDLTKYTTATRQRVEEALQLPEQTSEEKAQKGYALTQAIDQLVTVDQGLQHILQQVPSDLTIYTLSTRQLLEEALELPEQTNAEKASKIIKIQEALQQLVKIVDDDIQVALDDAKSQIPTDLSMYTETAQQGIDTALAMPEETNDEKQAKTAAILAAIANLA